MPTNLTLTVKKQLLNKIKDKYKKAVKKDKAKIIDNVVDLTGYDRLISNIAAKKSYSVLYAL